MPTSAPDDTTPTVVVTEVIDASPSFVFEALLDAESLPQWFGAPGGGTTSEWSLDVRPGGAWSATTHDASGRSGQLGGEFIDVDAPHTLAFTWFDSSDATANGIVRFTLDEMIVAGESCTRLTVTHVTGLSVHAGASTGSPDRRGRVEWLWRLHALVQLLGQSLVVSRW